MPAPRAQPPRREDFVNRDLLEKWAAQTPGRTFAVFEDLTEWSYARTLQEVRGTAAALQDLGVKQGDHVLVWLPNGADFLRCWLAINYIGAVCVCVNTAYRAATLEHVLRNAGGSLMVTLDVLADRLAEVDRATLKQVVLADASARELPGLRCHGAAALHSTRQPDPPPRPIEPWDPQLIIYTSGTTGPAKAVVSTYIHLHTMGLLTVSDRDGNLYAGPNDRIVTSLPMFHAGGLIPALSMLKLGGSTAIFTGFDTKTFWQKIKATGCTISSILGVMVSFLLKQPVEPGERDTPLRRVKVVPLTAEAEQFAERFGVTIHSHFNMSEVPVPLVCETNCRVVGSCGKPRKGMDVRLVDENDIEVADGEVGELIVRADDPWVICHAYHGDPAATARAWRNGWFHTGDGFRRDAEGNWFFVDRLKDAIRRRGENISSFEVESAVILYPGVREAAAVAVASEHSENEVLVAVGRKPGHDIEPAQLIEFLRPRLPYYAVPRYVRVLDDLPKAPTQKVQKFQLRADGVTPDTWDREAAGIQVRRDTLTRPDPAPRMETP
ncbi:AMP-binding protein [Ramlibacter albus]|uniref:AMP-binding protein n=1 Tax=Ramlibacter albus TaxID=2079448 RepID=A0A923MCU8_9BURK|nr:AMP-binding protein [Ramlibacter albus]MBC5767049.1 AMP-binding protein [Ramlibacter albus]